MARGRWHRRRAVSVLLFVGAASAALAAGGPDALVPFSDVAGAATEVSVAFVIDYGSLGPPVVGCVQVPSSDNGYYALAAFTANETEAAPIYNSADLLCSINNEPANAPTVCGERDPGGYDYWSYWHGTTGSWVYASTGASADVENGDVEGWRYETDGNANPNDPSPTPAPTYSSICGSVGPAPTTAPAPSTTLPVAVSTPPSPVAGGGSPIPKGSSVAPGSVTPTTVSGGGSSTTTSSAPTSTVPATGSGTHSKASTGSGGGAQSLRAADTADQEGSGSGAVPALIGALLVLALAAAAVLGWRRRARSQ
jgi:hypothetical protein